MIPINIWNSISLWNVRMLVHFYKKVFYIVDVYKDAMMTWNATEDKILKVRTYIVSFSLGSGEHLETIDIRYLSPRIAIIEEIIMQN